ncbi:calcium-binding protein KIC-like [Phalaenopsis equestris]|uniref:calcium-binding protein KIC-like n=1 Tax=Phalaenopsis equestris TaxID=78828 RepID=UPI0009E3F8B6|nr:calcium-binding protein KIC-like [Phalaenopsis equestris]
MANQECLRGFVDFLPSMAERLGTSGLLEELYRGFYHLVDPQRGMITLESLMQNARKLGIGELGEEQAVGMLRMGDLNGDGALDHNEFCMLMLRLNSETI